MVIVAGPVLVVRLLAVFSGVLVASATAMSEVHEQQAADEQDDPREPPNSTPGVGRVSG